MTYLPRILTLDDDPTMRALFAIAFRKLPVQLMQAENAAEAQCLLEKESPDLFLVDYFLGAENGLETAEKLLNKKDKAIPIILVTAETGGSLQQHLNAGRCLGYLLKPICLRTFGAEVLTYMNRSNDRVDYSSGRRAASAYSGHLTSAFLKSALTKAHDLSLRTDGALFEDDALEQTAHRWIGASGIGCVPNIASEAMELQGLARTKDPLNIPGLRHLLAGITRKFELASSFLPSQPDRTESLTFPMNGVPN